MADFQAFSNTMTTTTTKPVQEPRKPENLSMEDENAALRRQLEEIKKKQAETEKVSDVFKPKPKISYPPNPPKNQPSHPFDEEEEEEDEAPKKSSKKKRDSEDDHAKQKRSRVIQESAEESAGEQPSESEEENGYNDEEQSDVDSETGNIRGLIDDGYQKKKKKEGGTSGLTMEALNLLQSFPTTRKAYYHALTGRDASEFATLSTVYRKSIDENYKKDKEYWNKHHDKAGTSKRKKKSAEVDQSANKREQILRIGELLRGFEEDNVQLHQNFIEKIDKLLQSLQ